MKKFYKYPGLILFVAGLITIIFAIGVVHLKFDNNLRTFLPSDHPSRLTDQRISEFFGERKMISLMMRESGPEELNNFVSGDLTQLENKIMALDGVESLTSPLKAEIIEAYSEGMLMVPLIDPEKGLVAENLLSWPYLSDFVINRNNHSLRIIIQVRDNAEEGKVLDALKKIIEDFDHPGREYYFAGESVVLNTIEHSLKNDLLKLLPFAVLILVFFLFISFRSVRGIVLPVITVLLSSIWVVGLMSFMKIPLKIMTTAVPVLLVAVGSAYAIHFLSHYSDSKEEEDKKESRIRKIDQAVKRTGQGILFSGLTTIAGFGILGVSRISMIREFGLFTCAGVFFSLISAFTVMPALLILWPVQKKNRKIKMGSQIRNGLNRFLLRKTSLWYVIPVVAAVIALFGAMMIQTGEPHVMMFRKNTEIRKADRFGNRFFGGTTVLNILFASQEESALESPPVEAVEDDFFSLPGEKLSVSAPVKKGKTILDPQLFFAMQELGEGLKQNFSEVGSVSSIVDLLRRMNLVMQSVNGEQEQRFNEIPHDPDKYGLPDHEALKRLIAQYLLLYTGEVDLLLDSVQDPSAALMTIQLKDGYPRTIRRVIEQIEQFSHERLEPLGYTAGLGGEAAVSLAVNDLILKTQIRTALLSLVLVFFMLLIMTREFILALAALLPLSLALLINFGFMGLSGIRLTVMTAIVGSVAIGIGIDYTIHLLSGYRIFLSKSESPDQAMKKAVESRAWPILINSFSVAAGFSVLMLSGLNALSFFGLLTGITMIISAFMALTFLPVLLKLSSVYVRKIRRIGAQIKEETV